MKLLTKRLRERLLRNGKNRGQDHPPAVKFFHPCGAATWLFSELDEDGDTLWGLAYLGGGAPELGYSSLCQLGAFRGRFGLGIERDRHFRAKYQLLCRPRHRSGYANDGVMPAPSPYVSEQVGFPAC